ncbi:hypothetical protein B0T26DRAFT_756766 [Lasiosphaeria miniovina]|uniref:Uncharacterized protein n=1 Tax=Lasiosphaeria miniovina TaxID=1954250 RepID=A0AA39ZT69_9PEZI|nr:uncharacterized protein B0T26DRAFT_756766 [Lasiosphaeria miniovina]KAK0703202.1 hypothetical protein B0T26DRAFT_756766 [Lasiosphaeria miniovina]
MAANPLPGSQATPTPALFLSVSTDSESSTIHPVTEPTAENITVMQGFEWYVPADQKHWVRLKKQVRQLKQCKGSSKDGNGYDIYDLNDLGEFAQKGSVAGAENKDAQGHEQGRKVAAERGTRTGASTSASGSKGHAARDTHVNIVV